ncbi:hypothetical protein CTAYLR_000501 [Chrysophaeum taylorii]|uniref:Glycosyltransferase 2-like domain-containing protein n=1 Tax=Chrysophaeum taylorii TaxID=2483200 RepID=A0AAD7UIP0_9STRA|nr:hypothetical protein CTAYLR_000501 [Chrysophaeum taylorii]
MVFMKGKLDPTMPTQYIAKTWEVLTFHERIALVIFVGPVLLGCLYATHRLWSLLRYCFWTRCGTSRPPQPGYIKPGCEPRVTIQICCYNEAAVIAGTIDAACSVDWPKDRLIVEVLDDSDDETSGIIEHMCAAWRQKGVSACRRTRVDRVGYKAGNLYAHHKQVSTEFIAVFDSDHRAHPDFLRRTVSYFFDKNGAPAYEVGLVQCPWGYYNQHANTMTECDALNLDSAFVVDQEVRARSYGFLAFNGTGGVWRKTAIEAGEGWQWDTVTEDADLSYRSFIAGYKFRFVSDVVQLLEIPASITAFKSQKHRWTKGHAQVARKSLGYFLRTPLLATGVKVEAFVHLTMNIQYMVALWLILWMPMLAYHKLVIWQVLALSLYPAAVWLFVATTSIVKKPQHSPEAGRLLSRVARMLYIIPSCALAMGMSVNESVSFIEGLLSTDATFVRTPKDGDDGLLIDNNSTSPRKLSVVRVTRRNTSRPQNVSTAKSFDVKGLVLALEIIVTTYLAITAPLLIFESINDGRSAWRKYSHVPATCLSLTGFLWVTVATAISHWEEAKKEAAKRRRAAAQNRGRAGCLCSKLKAKTGIDDVDEVDATDLERPFICEGEKSSLTRRQICHGVFANQANHDDQSNDLESVELGGRGSSSSTSLASLANSKM